MPYLDMMERSVRKLESFIKDVISYSRNARLPVKNEPINFDLLVRSLLDDHQFAPNFGSIEFKLANERVTEIFSDETRLRIILNNLISNAIKFHDLSALHKKPFVLIKASGNDGHLVLTVEDNGRGIHEDYVNLIFNMFFRATDSVQGSGLGLYIMKETVHKLGGTVEVTSELGVGTRFIVTFPQNKPVVRAAPQAVHAR
ncbi:MAG: HAMP domain-containing histidine kinase [Bacteroidia bacterium]|nr:HAMP domain-containing histidine kinase [Bacteroidia bacterium]